MQKFTANYTYTHPNFVIQNLVENRINSDYLSVYFVLKNLLQRGVPTILSKYLQTKLGEIHKRSDFKTPFLLIDTETPIWHKTIKGDNENNYFPAKTFFEKGITPKYFGDYSFVQSLILPELEIKELVGGYNEGFINQTVDFFLPQAKLVIEIDGQQHKKNDVTRVQDSIRDEYLTSKSINIVRITTTELKNGTYTSKISEIIKFLQLKDKKLKHYKKAFQKIQNGEITKTELLTKLLPTAIIRFQILLLELLINGYLSLDNKIWKFNIFERDIKNFADLAIQDLFLWIENLCQLRKLNFNKPEVEVKTFDSKKNEILLQPYINIDFSLFKRYTERKFALQRKNFCKNRLFR